jgi:hypothetical protein
MPDKVRAGGLMRCCLLTLADYYSGAPELHAVEGQVLPCVYCTSSMIFSGGYWSWNHD